MPLRHVPIAVNGLFRFNQNLLSIQIMAAKVTGHAAIGLQNHDADGVHSILWARIN